MLLDILTDIAMEIGQTNTESEKSARIYRINKAAREIHEGTDLPESLREDVFDINVSSQQVSLPAYVYKVRGMRFFDGRHSINLDDMRNRYNFNYTGENELWYLQWRKKQNQALSREIANQSVIKVSVPLPEESSFTVTLTGSTDKSSRVTEILSFAVGDTEKTTTTNFVTLESIVKSRATKYDINLYDVENNLIGQIINAEYQSYYNIYQIQDTESFTMPANTSGVEIFYKLKFFPFKNDTDCFLGTDRYDSAIYWKFLEHRSKDVKDASAYAIKCNQLLELAFDNEQAGQRTKINFKPHPFLNLPYVDTRGLTRYK
jgi:hypothetical protein